MSSPYRNELDALRQRKAALEAELATLREQTTVLDGLRARESALAGEIAGIEGRLSTAAAPKRALPLLDSVRIASPCPADWQGMLGEGRVRFCLSCEKNVYDLSAMTRHDAEDLLRQHLGNDVCVRFYQRADGTILTQDCPVGVTKKRRKKLALAVAGAGAMAAAAATAFMRPSSQGVVMGGAVAYQGELTAPTVPVQTTPTTPTTTPDEVAPPPDVTRVAGGMRVDRDYFAAAPPKKPVRRRPPPNPYNER